MQRMDTRLFMKYMMRKVNLSKVEAHRIWNLLAHVQGVKREIALSGLLHIKVRKV